MVTASCGAAASTTGTSAGGVLALRWSPQSGFGDRISTWTNVFALALLRNDSVLLNWKEPMKKLPPNIAFDSMLATQCVCFPPFVITAAQRMFARQRSAQAPEPTWIPGFPYLKYGHGEQQEKHKQGLELVPHIMYDVWTGLRLLNSTTVSADAYVRAFRAAAAMTRLKEECESPVLDALRERVRQERSLLVCLHLRRTDRGGEIDFYLRHDRRAREKRQLFDNLTKHAVTRLARRLADRSLATTWLVLSDNKTDALAAQRWLNEAVPAGRESGQRTVLAPENASLALFYTMRRAHGIVQSVIRTGWSSFSGVPSLLSGRPLFSVHAELPPRFAMIERLRHRGDESEAAKEKLLYLQGEEDAFIDRMRALDDATPPQPDR